MEMLHRAHAPGRTCFLAGIVVLDRFDRRLSDGPRQDLRAFGTTSDELAALVPLLHLLDQAERPGDLYAIASLLAAGAGVAGRVDPAGAVHADALIHVKKVPGRKTAACDAEWLATLLRMGLLKKSFVHAGAASPSCGS